MSSAWRSTGLVAGSGAMCFLGASMTQGDPLLALEVLGVLLVARWGIGALVLVARTAALARALDRDARVVEIAGFTCRIVHGRAPTAFVAGTLRPSVYLTTGALETLTPGELVAVVLHEVHHASTLAPLRAALVQAWIRGAYVVPRLEVLLARRLAAIEIEADRFALVAGAARRDLASALVKLDAAATAIGFEGGGEERVRALLGDRRATPLAEPVEWLPLLVLAALLVGCRLAGTAAGI